MSVYRQCAWIAVMILVGLFGVAVGERDGSHAGAPSQRHATVSPTPALVAALDGAQITWLDEQPNQWVVVLDRPGRCTFYADVAELRPMGTVSSQADVCLWAR